jgi:hypothetical protein
MTTLLLVAQNPAATMQIDPAATHARARPPSLDFSTHLPD